MKITKNGASPAESRGLEERSCGTLGWRKTAKSSRLKAHSTKLKGEPQVTGQRAAAAPHPRRDLGAVDAVCEAAAAAPAAHAGVGVQ